MKFTKMHGSGNDYIYINCINNEINNLNKLALQMSNRHTGVGGDGIVLIYNSSIVDAKMRMFNSDGSEAKMCGNAIRCVCKYLFDNKIVLKKPMKIETLSGIKVCDYTLKNGLIDSVIVDMGTPSFKPYDIPVLLDKPCIDYQLNIDNKLYYITCLSVGNPHLVIFTDGLVNINLSKIGPLLENHYLFPERINVEFVQVVSDTNIRVRVWERGSGETLACGTGACASYFCALQKKLVLENQEIKVSLLGGDLYIKYENNHLFMRGDAVKVFEGEYNNFNEDNYD